MSESGKQQSFWTLWDSIKWSSFINSTQVVSFSYGKEKVNKEIFLNTMAKNFPIDKPCHQSDQTNPKQNTK